MSTIKYPVAFYTPGEHLHYILLSLFFLGGPVAKTPKISPYINLAIDYFPYSSYCAVQLVY